MTIAEITASTSDAPETTPAKGKYVAAPEHPIPAQVDSLLVTVLSWPRKHDTLQEQSFCKFLREHIKTLGFNVQIMAKGGAYVTTVPRPATPENPTPKPSTTLFSCHVDTCDYTTAPTAAMQQPPAVKKKLTYDPHFGIIALDKDSVGGCLGADDGAGVWLMLKMIERKVPGTYVFHRGEECGGIGSTAMAKDEAPWLSEFEAAVAFDRHDTYEVITHQRGGTRCASDKFGEALAKALTAQGMSFETSTRGVFTDTANYRKLIPECVNVAVGYHQQHGRGENLEYPHLAALLEAVCAINWDALPVDRDPGAVDFPTYGGYSGYGKSWGYGSDLYDDADLFTTSKSSAKRPAPGLGKPPKQQKKAAKKSTAPVASPEMSALQELSMMTLEELTEYLEFHPIEAAEIIAQLMLEIGRLRSDVQVLQGLLGLGEL